MELALNGITMQAKVISDIEPIAKYLDYLSLQEDRTQAVMFGGMENKLRFLAIPYHHEIWCPYTSDDETTKD